MIRYEKITPEPDVQGLRFDLAMGPGMTYDFNQAASLFEHHPKTGIMRHKYPDIRAMKIVRVEKALDLLRIERDTDPAILDKSIVNAAGIGVPWHKFFIRPSYGPNNVANLPLADLVSNIMHSPTKRFPAALMVEAAEMFDPHWQGALFSFKQISIRFSRPGMARRTVIPDLIVHGQRSDFYQLIHRPGPYLLAGYMGIEFGGRADEVPIYLKFNLSSRDMIASPDDFPVSQAAPKAAPVLAPVS